MVIHTKTSEAERSAIRRNLATEIEQLTKMHISYFVAFAAEYCGKLVADKYAGHL